MINKDDADISTDQMGYAVESAITLLGNAFAQMSMLGQQRILRVQKRAPNVCSREFLKAPPELFGPKFPHDATEHLEQLAALQHLEQLAALQHCRDLDNTVNQVFFEPKNIQL